MKYLITGGCGFIGRAVISSLLGSPGCQIRVLDNQSGCTAADLAEICDVEHTSNATFDASVWSENVQFIEGDVIDDRAVVSAAVGADAIVHLAANTGVGPSVEDPRSDCMNNVIGTLNVLEACRESGVGRMVFASSGAPLGVQEPPLHEELAAHPASPYGASKLAGEGYCSAYFHSFGINSVVLRFGNVYGPGSGHKSSVVAKFIRESFAGEKWEIYGDGSQTRDFIYIDDLVAAIVAAATKADVGGEVFQIATNRETSVSELTAYLQETLEAEGYSRPEVFFSEPRVGDVARNYSDTRKAKHILDWQAKVELRDGLVTTLRSLAKKDN